ncbi:MAG: hypothetical protein KKD39_03470, partial [Candidatus Altiarchaeota archaeon]|nr:hypothetical protein [Candidatus Altiarchaeota archaeon]
ESAKWDKILDGKTGENQQPTIQNDKITTTSLPATIPLQKKKTQIPCIPALTLILSLFGAGAVKTVL